MPPRWFSSSRVVMGHSFFGKTGQYSCTGASRSSLSPSESCRMAVAVMGLETEARRKSVAEVAGTKFSRSAMPKPADQAGWPLRTTATETPGTLVAAMKSETDWEICDCFSLERVWAWRFAVTRTRSRRSTQLRRGLRSMVYGLAKKIGTSKRWVDYSGKGAKSGDSSRETRGMGKSRRSQERCGVCDNPRGGGKH